MPRLKKSEDTSSRKKKGKKPVEDEYDDDDEIINEVVPKKSKKVSDKKKSKKSRKDEPEDELSDIDIDNESGNDLEGNDEVINGDSFSKRKQIPRKEIDPETPIGELKTEDILSYLINIGNDTLNPQLKFGSLDLLNQLTGRRRRQPMYGANRGNFNQRGRGYMGDGGGRGYMGDGYRGGRGRPNMGPRGSRPQQTPNENLYGDNE